MSDKSAIEWTDATWNPIRGCSRVSEGCRNCYAERVASRFSGPGKPYEGLVTDKGRWNGTVKLVPEHLADPLRWQRPRRIFVNSMSDLFHEALTNEQIAAVFGVMGAAPQHTFQVLTKRPERALAWFRWVDAEWQRERESPSYSRLSTQSDICQGAAIASGAPHGRRGISVTLTTPAWPLRNVWLLTSVEDAAQAVDRIPHLLQCPAVVHGLSVEPLLGPLDDLLDVDGPVAKRWAALEPDALVMPSDLLDWIIVGGESGPGARPMHPDWVRSLRDQCEAAGVPFFFKQWGEWKPISEISDSGASLYRDAYPYEADYPEDLRVRECRVRAGVIRHDGEFFEVGAKGAFELRNGRPAYQTFRVGKHAAGRLLDGRIHDAFPGADARADALRAPA